jgi:hypothetical protein
MSLAGLVLLFGIGTRGPFQETKPGSSVNTGGRESKKYYLANLPAKTDLRTLAATIKARWVCEQAHQQ